MEIMNHTHREPANFVPQHKLLRVLSLMMELYGRKFTAKQAANFLDTTDRTAYRYFHLLEAVGISMDSIDGRYFIAQDDCPFCHGMIKEEADDFAISVSSTEFQLLTRYYSHNTGHDGPTWPEPVSEMALA